MVMMAIAGVLDGRDLAEARRVLGAARFVDGKATAGWAARLVKDNQQAASGDPQLEGLRRLVGKRLGGNELFRLAARPKALTPLLFSRYGPGRAYGAHVDDALMGGMRADVSFTLFLSDPESYRGGALVVETSAGEEEVRLPAGSLFVYPSTTLHRVEAVTEGERLAAVGWARSLVRDAARRELLFDLETARLGLFRREGKTREFDLLSKSAANLLRMWVED